MNRERRIARKRLLVANLIKQNKKFLTKPQNRHRVKHSDDLHRLKRDCQEEANPLDARGINHPP